MTPRFILYTTAVVLLAACDRNTTAADSQRVPDPAQENPAEQAVNDRIGQLEQRINDAERLKAVEREAELARAKEELAQLKRERDEERVSRKTAVPGGGIAVRADLERVADEDYADEADPVYQGRVVPATQQVTSVETFYEPLDNYGDWIQTDDYGYVFQPQVATGNRNWRPYTDGHWVQTDYGWTWQSNEDFGWATYHYGRWARVSGAGWVWVPGKEWAPAWVSWRRGGDHCGWAPLPPESRTKVRFTSSVDRDYDIGPAAYVFVALSNFGARSYAPVVEPPERNVTIINKTVNITNVTYNTTNEKTVVYNGGPRYDIMRAQSKQPVERVNLNFAAPSATTVNNTKIVNVQKGDTFQVAAPPMVTGAQSQAPKRVKEKLGKAKIEKGWEGVDPAKMQEVKQEIAATSVERKKRAPKAADAAAIPNTAAPNPPDTNPVKPEAVKPEKPKTATSDSPKPEDTKPHVPKEEMPKADAPRPGAIKREGGNPQPPRPDAQKPVADQPEIPKADRGQKPAKPEKVKPDPTPGEEPIRPKAKPDRMPKNEPGAALKPAAPSPDATPDQKRQPRAERAPTAPDAGLPEKKKSAGPGERVRPPREEAPGIQEASPAKSARPSRVAPSPETPAQPPQRPHAERPAKASRPANPESGPEKPGRNPQAAQPSRPQPSAPEGAPAAAGEKEKEKKKKKNADGEQ